MANPEVIAQAIAYLEHKGQVGKGADAEDHRHNRRNKLLVLQHAPCTICKSFSVKVNPEKKHGSGVIFKCHLGGDPIGLFPEEWIPLYPKPSCPLLHQP